MVQLGKEGWVGELDYYGDTSVNRAVELEMGHGRGVLGAHSLPTKEFPLLQKKLSNGNLRTLCVMKRSKGKSSSLCCQMHGASRVKRENWSRLHELKIMI